jgi:hypothetical protein
VTDLTNDQVRDPAYLEVLVALGHDVVFDIALASSAHQNSDYVWTPDDGATPGGGHSMLIVGYNRSKQYFIVRNSWGYDTSCHEGGYVRMCYDYFRSRAASSMARTTTGSAPITPRGTARRTGSTATSRAGSWRAPRWLSLLNHEMFRGDCGCLLAPVAAAV